MAGKPTTGQTTQVSLDALFDPFEPEAPVRKRAVSTKGPAVILCAAIVLMIFTITLTVIVFFRRWELQMVRRDQNRLLALAEEVKIKSIEPSDPAQTGVLPYIGEFDNLMRRINGDYLCWLTIDGTNVDYPVVRGRDNEQYLSISFYGEQNKYGTLFMDYRCRGDYVPHIIIFGHNAKTGEMFGGLREFLNEQYRAEHPTITVNINERYVDYSIFSARLSDINDPAYNVNFDEPGAFAAFAKRCGAPPDTAQIITLSTCVKAGDDAERIIVQGALR